MAGLGWSISHWQKTATGMEHMPHPTSWLNDQRWNDELVEGQAVAKVEITPEQRAANRAKHIAFQLKIGRGVSTADEQFLADYEAKHGKVNSG